MRAEVTPIEEIAPESSQWKLLYTVAIVVAILTLTFLGIYYYTTIVETGKVAAPELELLAVELCICEIGTRFGQI